MCIVAQLKNPSFGGPNLDVIDDRNFASGMGAMKAAVMALLKLHVDHLAGEVAPHCFQYLGQRPCPSGLNGGPGTVMIITLSGSNQSRENGANRQGRRCRNSEMSMPIAHEWNLPHRS